MNIYTTRSHGQRRKVVSMLCAAALFVANLGLLYAQTATTATQVDRTRLEIIEDLSESLANDLLELSVATRDRNLEQTAEFWPAKLSANAFPAKPLPISPVVKWIGARQWTADASPQVADAQKVSLTTGATGAATTLPTVSREDFMRDWTKFLAHFSEIEDARFKVKDATFEMSAQSVPGAKVPTAAPGAKGKARIAFYVIGRNRDGQREWARGVTNVVVKAAENGRWQFEQFTLASLDSLVGMTELFSEVSVPAGVAHNIPAYGTQGNSGFVWHGAAAADFNRDGFIDLFVTSAKRNFLYLNDGKGKFRNASEQTGVAQLATGTAPLVLDYDNDGDPDVFISSVGQQILLENRLAPDGKLEFHDVSSESGVGAASAIGFSAVAGDVNNDGFLDIYVTSYNRYGQITPDSWFRATNGTPNLLFVNQGNGTFREEAAKWGVDDRRWSYAAEFADVNGDGKIDLYVANDFGEKALFINTGGKFVDEAKERGVLDPGNGMGVSFGDYNNDGLLDLHASNMSSTAGNRILGRIFPNSSAKDNVLKKLAAGNNLFENTGGGNFKDVTAEVGGFSGGWAWGGGFIDFDNDGWEDVYTPNGFISGKSMKDT
ncbi:MAG: VCBS repeat-containing protein [Acidobacteriota bacterium]|nr:VCBS repeat-containing protein [Acidobacteriota bacterium]